MSDGRQAYVWMERKHVADLLRVLEEERLRYKAIMENLSDGELGWYKDTAYEVIALISEIENRLKNAKVRFASMLL